MKERPIIFNTEMVRAILNGRKTQTRRVVKLHKSINTRSSHSVQGKVYSMGDIQRESEMNLKPNILCPYGTIGDRLWVRETWMVYNTPQFQSLEEDLIRKPLVFYKAKDKKYKGEKWKPSIFMPRWASRITLEITGVRVERVQEISFLDAIDEGLQNEFDDTGKRWFKLYGGFEKHGQLTKSYKWAMKTLWDSLNAKRGYPWESNPWVWVIEFKLMEVSGRERD